MIACLKVDVLSLVMYTGSVTFIFHFIFAILITLFLPYLLLYLVILLLFFLFIYFHSYNYSLSAIVITSSEMLCWRDFGAALVPLLLILVLATHSALT